MGKAKRQNIALQNSLLPGTTLRLLTCECADGYEPIPDPYRMIGQVHNMLSRIFLIQIYEFFLPICFDFLRCSKLRKNAFFNQ